MNKLSVLFGALLGHPHSASAALAQRVIIRRPDLPAPPAREEIARNGNYNPLPSLDMSTLELRSKNVRASSQAVMPGRTPRITSVQINADNHAACNAPIQATVTVEGGPERATLKLRVVQTGKLGPREVNALVTVDARQTKTFEVYTPWKWTCGTYSFDQAAPSFIAFIERDSGSGFFAQELRATQVAYTPSFSTSTF
jgi:hypothetical protein